MWEWNTKVGACCLVGSKPIQSLLMLLANTGEPKKRLGNRRLVLNCRSQFAGTVWKCCAESISRFKCGCGLTLQPANECLGLRRRRCVAQLF